MKCGRCGSEIKKDWKYCPECGSRRGGDPFDAFGRDLFSQVFGKMRNTMPGLANMEKGMERDIEAIDLSPMFRREEGAPKPKRKGFTVQIRSGTGMKPKVDIKTYGGVDRESVERRVEERFGVQDSESSRFRLPRMRKALPKKTEEPETDTKRIADGVAVDIHLPGVMGTEDIDIKELSSSVEVRAIAGDKAYFKILTKPEDSRIKSTDFRDGTLRMEFS